MSGYLTFVTALIGFLAEIVVVVCAALPRNFRSYFPLGFYMLCAAAETIALYVCLLAFGETSHVYLFLYYYCDSLLMLAMFWVIIRFYLQVFEEMGVSKQIRAGAAFLLLLAALFSYAV